MPTTLFYRLGFTIFFAALLCHPALAQELTLDERAEAATQAAEKRLKEKIDEKRSLSRARIATLEQELTVRQQTYLAWWEVNKRPLLDEIQLPENPTSEEAKAYIKALREFTLPGTPESRVIYDAIVDKLKILPYEHNELLARESINRTTLRLQASDAREIILSQSFLEKNPRPARIDQNTDIELALLYTPLEEVRERLVDHIQNPESYKSPLVLLAATELRDPALYPTLQDILADRVPSSIALTTLLPALALIPDYDIVNTADICFKVAKEKTKYKSNLRRSEATKFIAQFGNIEALGYIIDNLQKRPIDQFSRYRVTGAREILTIIDFHGTDAEIKAWYKKNKNELVFDTLRGKYTLLEPF